MFFPFLGWRQFKGASSSAMILPSSQSNIDLFHCKGIYLTLPDTLWLCLYIAPKVFFVFLPFSFLLSNVFLGSFSTAVLLLSLVCHRRLNLAALIAEFAPSRRPVTCRLPRLQNMLNKQAPTLHQADFTLHAAICKMRASTLQYDFNN